MANLFRLSLIDFKYVVKTRELWIALGIISFYTLSMYTFTLDGEKSYTADFFYQLIHDLSFYVMILLPAAVLAKDYTFKTTRILYTGPYSKRMIVNSKFLSMLIFYAIASVVHRLSANSLLLYHERTFSIDLLLQNLLQTIFVYMIVGLFICLFAFFITLLTYSRMATMISVIAVFIVEKYLRGVILLLFQQDLIKKLLTHNPINIASQSLQYSSITIMDSFILLMTTSLLGVGTIVILYKKEIQ